MKENLEELNSRGLAERWPVLLGGAALTRAYVEQDLAELYGGEVRYARDAFEGLRLMDALMAVKRGEPGADAPAAARAPRPYGRARWRSTEPDDMPARSDVATDNKVPTPPFWGDRVVKGIPLADYAALPRRAGHLPGPVGPQADARRRGPVLRGAGRDRGPAAAAHVARPDPVRGPARGRRGLRLLPVRERGRRPGRPARRRLRAHPLHLPAAAPRPAPVPVRLLPSPRSPARSTWWRFQLVTVGTRISEATAGAVRARTPTATTWSCTACPCSSTEALAEFWHARIRDELGFGAEDPEDLEEFFKQGYRGSRYSFGYPRLPRPGGPGQDRRAARPGADRGRACPEEFQLVPEQSTDAIVVHHPEAKYFNT